MSATVSAQPQGFPTDPGGASGNPLGDLYGGLLPATRDPATGKWMWGTGPAAAAYRPGPNYDMATVDTPLPSPPVPTGPVQAQLGNALAPAPNTTYGTVLPFATDNTTGATRLAMPGLVRSTLQGFVDLADGPATGEVTPEAAGALGAITGRNLLSAAGDTEASLSALGARSRRAKAPPVAEDNPLAAAGAAPAARPAPVDTAPGAADRISTRVPTGKGLEDPAHLTSELTVGRESSEAARDSFKKNAELIRSYPGIRLTPGATDAEVADQFTQHLKDNILALHDAVTPEIAGRSKKWYDGANAIANRWAEEMGLHPRATAGALAALSPQMDWFKNVDLARRVIDISRRQGNTSLTPEMEAYAKKYIDGVANDKGTKANPKDPTEQAALAANLTDHLDSFQGKPFSQVQGDLPRAIWTRWYDEAHNPRGYRVVSPEGEMMGPAMTDKGAEAKTGWGGFGEIAKAIGALRDHSVENISRTMGAAHKVRNFYNNIISPNARSGDVTIDTHAIAAALLRPLSGADAEVKAGLGSGGGASSHAGTGSKGLYGLYADAYRQAANERGILPREMQSITWEAGRGLWTAGQKRNKMLQDQISDAWHDYQTGDINGDAARERIFGLSGRIDPPEWHGSNP